MREPRRTRGRVHRDIGNNGLLSTNIHSLRFFSKGHPMRLLHRHRGFIYGLFLLCASPLSAAVTAADAITPDGGRYYGPLQNGQLHGRGRLEWDNGTRYEGEFAHGLMSGRGRMALPDDYRYDGEFRQGHMHGRGRMQFADGAIYTGEFRNNLFHGQGLYKMADGAVYEGNFKAGHFSGQGRYTDATSTYRGEFKYDKFSGLGALVYNDGRKYQGEFAHGEFHGTGRYETPAGDVYEGTFVKNELTGSGSRRRKDGSLYRGDFRNWLMHGHGRYTDASGNVYEGRFAHDALSGRGKFVGHGVSYEGKFKDWRPHGHGVMRLANGDVYTGGFADGAYEGQGTLKYARVRADGRTYERGVWRYGRLHNGAADRAKTAANVESALYTQRTLLNDALAALRPRDPMQTNMYLLAVAGDGSQEVFRREVEFVQDQFDRRFGTRGRSLALINSRNTVTSAPMATHTSLREALLRMAAHMDKNKDILFLFLTSHGSKQHELTLDQNGMDLRGVSAQELQALLKQTGIRWKVVVVSACYSGGFIDRLKDNGTLVIAAARRDRRSFGCADENDFTHFGRAFFKEALPQSRSFGEAFHKASVLVKEWELQELKGDAKRAEAEYSLPQIHNPPAIDRHLQQWWTQQAAPAASARR